MRDKKFPQNTILDRFDIRHWFYGILLSMSDKPSLHPGDPPSRLARRQTSVLGFRLLLSFQLLTMIGIGAILRWPPPAANTGTVDSKRIQELRDAAVALEERSLSEEAAAAWKDYLAEAPHADDRAQVLYRIGGLLIDAEDHSGAVTALVRAEQLAEDDRDLTLRIGPKIVDCLRRLGNYGEVGRELSRQVEVGARESTQANVLAKFAGESFTDADLDRMIERTVDRLLAMQLDAGRLLDRDLLLKQYESGAARQEMLHEVIQRELFSRRARELKLDRQDSFRKIQEFLETDLLASRFLSTELGKIQPTDVDIESYYNSHTADYRQPETAEVVILPISADESDGDVLAGIETPDDFRAAANAAAGNTILPKTVITRGEPHPGLGDTSAIFELSEGEWTTTPVRFENETLLVLVDKKSPASTPALLEIRFRVETDYRRRKRQELMQQLTTDLMSRYDVEIVDPVQTPAGEPDDDRQMTIGK